MFVTVTAVDSDTMLHVWISANTLSPCYYMVLGCHGPSNVIARTVLYWIEPFYLPNTCQVSLCLICSCVLSAALTSVDSYWNSGSVILLAVCIHSSNTSSSISCSHACPFCLVSQCYLMQIAAIKLLCSLFIAVSGVILWCFMQCSSNIVLTS